MLSQVSTGSVVPYASRFAASMASRAWARNYAARSNAARVIQGAFRNRKVIINAARATRDYLARINKRRRTTQERTAPEAAARAETKGLVAQYNPPIKHLEWNSIDFGNEAVATTHNRTGNQLYLHGIKTCFTIHNEAGIVCKFNVALLQTKTGICDTDPHDRFFRDPDSDTSRVKDFVNNHSSTESLRYNCYSINPDKYFICWRASKVLYPYDPYSGAALKNEARDYLWDFSKYFRYNKKITFDEPSDTLGQNKFLVAFWAEPLKWDEGVDDPQTLLYKVNLNNLVYYRNVN